MVKMSFVPSKLSLAALQTLSVSQRCGLRPLEWWGSEISPLAPEDRTSVLKELALMLAKDMRGISGFAQNLGLDKAKYPTEFEIIFFDFLLPLQQALIQQGAWEEALNLELTLYVIFIRQDENQDFYERAFAGLYSAYTSILRPSTVSAKLPREVQSGGATLFWFQNYSILAHTQLALNLVEHLPMREQFYASALSNAQLEESRSIFAFAGIEVLQIDDRQAITARCNELISLCKIKDITNIVFVSLPLQSGYIKTVCNGISLTWWSMKYPLGCMPHFDRLVCNRTLYPTQKIFHGALWECAPFAVKAIAPSPAPVSVGSGSAELKVGVLSREEKFSSSRLPELLSICLDQNPSLELFWTGRKEEPTIVQRIEGRLGSAVRQRINFCGWVDPANFLTRIDLLVDTPNLGGMAAYWAMSIGRVVISASDSGSVGSLGSRKDLEKHFKLLSSYEDICEYFDSPAERPYYLTDAELIPMCVFKYANHRGLVADHGRLFSQFFYDVLSDMGRWSALTHQMLKGSNIK